MLARSLSEPIDPPLTSSLSHSVNATVVLPEGSDVASPIQQQQQPQHEDSMRTYHISPESREHTQALFQLLTDDDANAYEEQGHTDLPRDPQEEAFHYS